ncbi:MAG: hypothetical protein CMB80_14665 [Flammeovirgaceae bacterium]|nr:hypothetical protein [Flammeovirgaceae bacterium]
MESASIPILVDAKTEYTKQLTSILKVFLYDGIKSIYVDCKNYCVENKQNTVLLTFQEALSKIPKWNQDIIDTETERIIKESNCDWLADLITAVFVSHTKILISIKPKKNTSKINLQIPKLPVFIHKCYIECAREFWKNPYLFDDNINQCDYQRNMRDCETIISLCICETVRKLLPVKHIVKEYLGKQYKEEDDEDISKLNSNNLKMLVQKEIENYSKSSLSKPEEFTTEVAITEKDTSDNTEVVIEDRELQTTSQTPATNIKKVSGGATLTLTQESVEESNPSQVQDPEVQPQPNVKRITLNHQSSQTQIPISPETGNPLSLSDTTIPSEIAIPESVHQEPQQTLDIPLVKTSSPEIKNIVLDHPVHVKTINIDDPENLEEVDIYAKKTPKRHQIRYF